MILAAGASFPGLPKIAPKPWLCLFHTAEQKTAPGRARVSVLSLRTGIQLAPARVSVLIASVLKARGVTVGQWLQALSEKGLQFNIVPKGSEEVDWTDLWVPQGHPSWAELD